MENFDTQNKKLILVVDDVQKQLRTNCYNIANRVKTIDQVVQGL